MEFWSEGAVGYANGTEGQNPPYGGIMVFDVQSGLNRIAAGETFPHRNDGAVFKNLEGKLPNKYYGYGKSYYREDKRK